MAERPSPQDLIYGTIRKAGGAAHRRPRQAGQPHCIPRSIRTSQSKSLGRLWVGVEIVLDRREAHRPAARYHVHRRRPRIDRQRSRLGSARHGSRSDVAAHALGRSCEERVAWFSLYGVREYWLVQPHTEGHRDPRARARQPSAAERSSTTSRLSNRRSCPSSIVVWGSGWCSSAKAEPYLSEKSFRGRRRGAR